MKGFHFVHQSEKNSKTHFLGYMEIWICPATSLLLHVQFACIFFRLYAQETIKKQDSARNRTLLLPARSCRKLICFWIQAACGRNLRWKVLTLWLGEKGKSWALAVLTNEALNSGCETALYNDFCWRIAVKSAFLWRKSLNLKLVEHFCVIPL